VRKPAGCCPRQSCAASLVGQLKDLVPGHPGDVRLEPGSLEGGLPEPESTPALPFRHNTAQTHFDNNLHRCMLLLGELSYFFKETIWYLYGCIHMANHITEYGNMSINLSKEPVTDHPSILPLWPISSIGSIWSTGPITDN